VTGVLLYPDCVRGTACHLTCDFLTLATTTSNAKLKTFLFEQTAAQCTVTLALCVLYKYSYLLTTDNYTHVHMINDTSDIDNKNHHLLL